MTAKSVRFEKVSWEDTYEVFMRALNVILFVFLATILGSIQTALAQTQAPAPPQTARQALLEMFIAPKAGAFEKHLPDATRKALLRGTDVSHSDVLNALTNFSVGLTANQEHFETFDVGPILLSMESPGGYKREILVEGDDLIGDTDEIDLTLRSYKDGALEPLPAVPRFSLTMKQEEKDVWKLNEIAVTLRVPLGDEEYLKGLRKTEDKSSESSAVANLRTLNTAEISYAAAYSERGFTCKLAELGGSSAENEPKPEQAMLIDDVLASGQKSGYVFSISGCDASPASKYEATAVPSDPDSGMRAFCSDESAVIRFADDGKASTCLSAGVPLQ